MSKHGMTLAEIEAELRGAAGRYDPQDSRGTKLVMLADALHTERERIEATVHPGDKRCDCGNPSGHEDTIHICCDCGGYRP